MMCFFQVQTAQNKETEVPAIVLVIPPPDPASFQEMNKLVIRHSLSPNFVVVVVWLRDFFCFFCFCFCFCLCFFFRRGGLSVNMNVSMCASLSKIISLPFFLNFFLSFFLSQYLSLFLSCFPFFYLSILLSRSLSLYYKDKNSSYNKFCALKEIIRVAWDTLSFFVLFKDSKRGKCSIGFISMIQANFVHFSEY